MNTFPCMSHRVLCVLEVMTILKGPNELVGLLKEPLAVKMYGSERAIEARIKILQGIGMRFMGSVDFHEQASF